MTKFIRTVAFVGLFFSSILLIVRIFHYSPRKIRKEGVSHAGEVVKIYERRSGGPLSSRHSVGYVDVLLENNEKVSIQVKVKSLEFFTVGEKLPIWELRGYWYVDKYGNMDRPNAIPYVLGFVCLLLLSS
jgi:hypothetical protein